MTQAPKKKKRKPKFFDILLADRKQAEDYEYQLSLRYHWLLIDQMEHERKIRLKAVRLSRKYRKQPWVI